MADICSAQGTFQGFGATSRFAASVVVTPAAVAATTVASQTGTVLGLRTDMVLSWQPIAPATNAALVQVICSASDVAKFTYVNPTDGSVTPTSGTVYIVGH